MKKWLGSAILIISILCVFLWDRTPAFGQFFELENGWIGEAAPDFTLKTLQGEMLNMTKYRNDHPAIIFFWATWCPHCREALKELNQNWKTIEDQGIKIILVDLNEEERAVRPYVERNKIKLPVFLDTEASLAEAYTIIGVPTFFFVDRGGIVRSVDHALPENYEEILKFKPQSAGSSDPQAVTDADSPTVQKK